MRNKVLFLLLLLCSQSLYATAKIENWQTAHGSRVYFVQTTGLPLVDIRVVFDAGSARDGEQYGISSLTSALLGTSAGEWDTDTIAQRFENVGAQFGASTSRDMGWLSLRSLTQKDLLTPALETLQVILASPAFDEKDFKREKQLTLAALKHREEQPGALASIAFNKALYGEHPYAHPVSGFTKNVAALNADDLKRFYQRYYVASNAIVVIVGNMDRQQAKVTAEQLLSGLPVGEKPAEIPRVVSPEQGVTEHIEFPSTQTHVLSGLPGVYRKDPDYFALYVGNHILGGSGLVSKLAEEVREKRGLAYSAYSYFSPLFRKGAFTMGLQTRNDQTQKAVSVMLKTLRDFIANGPTDKELDAAKKNITGGFVMRFDTNSKLTSYVAMIGFYQLPLNYLDTFSEKITAVSTAAIKDAFKRRVNPDLLQTVTVGATTEAGAK